VLKYVGVGVDTGKRPIGRSRRRRAGGVKMSSNCVKFECDVDHLQLA
jgi:hypothetical protein